MKWVCILVLVSALAFLVGCGQRQADYTRGVPANCRLHNSQMMKTNVPILYGLIRLNERGRALAAASSNSFPNAQAVLLAGCIIGPNSPTQAVIYVCPKCQTARQMWELDHERR